MKQSFVVSTVLAALSLFFLSASKSEAMPNFARKYGVDCSLCHMAVPRLNEFGYRFRAAGFRMPDTIGKADSDKFELGNYMATRLQARYDLVSSHAGSQSSPTKSSLSFHEVTLYPATGAWGKYFSSLFELSIAPEEPTEIENAYVRVNAGNEKRFVSARVGIFHPFEGYGASDRPLSLSRPFLQTSAANNTQTTYFKPWGFDQAGAEAGLDYNRTSVRFAVFNGLVLKEEDGAFLAFPAQGGSLSKGANLPSRNRPDYQVFVNQILNSEGGNLSFYYYNGVLPLPAGGDIDNLFTNHYDRFGVYAGYPVHRKLHLLSGLGQGHDQMITGQTFTSRGVFGEADVPVNQYATAGVRYDWFDPSGLKANNELSGVTGFINVPLQNGFQLIGEYQRKSTLRGLSPEKKDNVFQVRFIFIL